VTQVLLVAGERAVAEQEGAVIARPGLRGASVISGRASAWLPLARRAAVIALDCGTFQYDQ
jgi:hypothetical protein